MDGDEQLWDDRHLFEDDQNILADTRVHMTYQGERFVFALTDEHAQDLGARLAPYMTAARAARVFRREAARRTSLGRPARKENGEIRRWARKNGFKIGSGGPIKQEIRESYQAAHPPQD